MGPADGDRPFDGCADMLLLMGAFSPWLLSCKFEFAGGESFAKLLTKVAFRLHGSGSHSCGTRLPQCRKDVKILRKVL